MVRALPEPILAPNLKRVLLTNWIGEIRLPLRRSAWYQCLKTFLRHASKNFRWKNALAYLFNAIVGEESFLIHGHLDDDEDGEEGENPDDRFGQKSML